MVTKRKGSKRAPAPSSLRESLEDGAHSGLEPLLIYIHGIGEQLPRDELKQSWDLALFGVDLGARSQMAYWADILHPLTLNSSTPSTKGKRRQALNANGGGTATGAAAQSPQDLLRLAGIDTSNQHALAFAQALWDQSPAQIGSATHSGARKNVLPLPATLRKPIARAFLQTFIPDTAAYLFRPELRRQMRQRLSAQLKLPALPKGQPVVLVAHSQGSLIAYEVLSELGKAQVNVQAWITLGSPLGLRELQDYLVPSELVVPKVVRRWVNFADPFDPVALDKGLASDFACQEPDPAEGESAAFGPGVEDQLIVNAEVSQLKGFNPHAAEGYLAHPKVLRVVAEALHIDAVGRFIMARDVAKRLSLDDSVRQPVLLEALEPGYPALGETPEHMDQLEQLEVAQLADKEDRPGAALQMQDRIRALTKKLKAIVPRAQHQEAQIDPLRRFVAARLTASELRQVCLLHADLRVYAVWRSSSKSKHTERSMRPIKADAALASFSANGADITWAVLDTGIQGNHPHFEGVLQAVWDCTGSGPPKWVAPPSSVDRDGHGTHVAGIIAGRRARGGSQRGVAPNARLVVYKVLKDDGSGEDSFIIKALDHIAASNEQVGDGLAIHGINLSLGGPFDNSVYGCGFSPICAELRRQWRAGVMVVVSAGNEGTLEVSTPDGSLEINSVMSIGDPANLEECVAVGSVHADKPHLYGISAFSSRGPTADGRGKPDVVAPGERISSCNSAFRANDKNSFYRADSGTSMAAPHVSGLLAAFLSARREFRGRPDEVKKLLLRSCTDLGRDRYHQGAGMPNLMQMLLSA